MTGKSHCWYVRAARVDQAMLTENSPDRFLLPCKIVLRCFSNNMSWLLWWFFNSFQNSCPIIPWLRVCSCFCLYIFAKIRHQMYIRVFFFSQLYLRSCCMILKAFWWEGAGASPLFPKQTSGPVEKYHHPVNDKCDCLNLISVTNQSKTEHFDSKCLIPPCWLNK